MRLTRSLKSSIEQAVLSHRFAQERATRDQLHARILDAWRAERLHERHAAG